MPKLGNLEFILSIGDALVDSRLRPADRRHLLAGDFLMKTTGAETAAKAAASSREAITALNLDLRESEDRYRTLFDLVPVAVYTIDNAGVIQSFNSRAAELWGRTPALGDTD